jgi:hypothetical protein
MRTRLNRIRQRCRTATTAVCGRAGIFACCLGLILAVLTGAPALTAQTITGSIVGTVTDPSGAVVAGAKVTATNVSTGVVTSTKTNSEGLYNIRFLPIGPYKVAITAAGFSTETTDQFPLDADQTAKFNIKLQVGSASVNVEVSATFAALQTENATLQTTFSSDVISDLPLNGLNFQTAAMFVPGVVNPGFASMGGADGNERQQDWYDSPSFNGNRGQANNYILDGVDMNETLNNMSGYNPAPESIGEMKVITGNADAEFGNVNGGELLVQTKSGTNTIHGSLYDNFQNNAIAATAWNGATAYGLPQYPFTQNQFGASISGPILKNKLFLFGDYLGFRYHRGGYGLATVAPPAFLTGDFSLLYTPQYGGIQLYNPNGGNAGYSTATPYGDCTVTDGPCNQVPVVNPVAKFLTAHPSLYPAPNFTPCMGCGDYHNYEGPEKGYTVNNQGDAKIDYHITDRDSLMARYSIGDAYDFSQTVLPVQFPTNNDFPFQSLVLNYIHTFSASLVNEFRAGVSRTVFNQGLPDDASGVFGTNGDKLVGLPMANQAYQGFSEMAFSGNESNVGTSAIVTLIRENNFYYADNLTWQHGHHALKFGAQILRYQQNYYYAGNSGALGSFSYSGQYTYNANAENGYGYSFADFVMDESSSINIGGVSGLFGQRQYRDGFFVQDDWRVFPNLTVNLGVRYGYNQPIYEVNNKQVSVNISNPSLITINGLEFAGKDGNSRALYNPFYGGVMPRIGFAWSPSSRFVLRGGFGISDAMEGTGTNRRMTQNYPFQSSLSAASLSPSGTANGSAGFPVENGFSFGPGAAGTPLANYSNFNLWDPHIKPAFVEQFNLAWQYLISTNWTAQVGYVGELGKHLIVPNEVNQWSSNAPWNAFLNGYNGYNYNGWNYDCSGAAFTPSPSCGLTGNYGNLQETTSNAVSNYNALQASITHLPTHGLSYRFNYTWSKALTNNAGFYGAPNVSISSWFFQDSTNPMGDYGPAGQDVRNAFNGYFSYLLPFGRGQQFGSNMPRALDEVAGGWKISGSVVMYSGFPITMGSGEQYNVNSFGAHSQHFRPMHIANRAVGNWFGNDPSALPCVNFDNNGNILDNGTCAYGLESYNYFGNSQDGSERAPGYRQVDLSAMKIFHITDRHSLEFRGDAFNALNIVSYGAPYSYLGDYNPAASNGHGLFGIIAGSNSSQRIMQIAMHYRF